MKKSIILIMMLSLCSFSNAAEVEKAVPGTFTMYAAKMVPCVILEEDEATGEIEISGFEIDLWKAICKDLAAQGLIKDSKFVPVEWAGIEPGMKSGEIDGACSGLTIRSARLEWSDFTMPTFNSGLGIMVLKKDAGMLNGLVLMYTAMKGPVIFFALFLLTFAFILWVSEKDKNPDNDANGISDKFFPGIFEAIYFCIVTCSTVGYGDFAPKKWRTRVITAVLIVVGLIAFGNFLSLVSVARIEGSIDAIQGPSDLKGQVVLTQKGTTSVDTVKALGAKAVTTRDIDSACDGLLLGRGDAVVFDYPVLLNYVKENPDKVKMVAGMFDDQYYGYMLKKGSPLKDAINLAILKLYEDGTYKTLYDKWF